MLPVAMLAASTLASGAMSFMSGMGARSSAKRTERLQIWEQQRVEQMNRQAIADHNQLRGFAAERLRANPVNMEAFMADGARAGFNPVTWLNSGALSLYSNEIVEKMGLPDAIFSSSPMTFQNVPSVQSAIGNAGQAAINTFQSGYKTLMAQDMQWNMLERQLSAMGNRTAASSISNFGMGAFVPNASGVSAGGVASLAGSLSLSGLPYPQKWKPGDVEYTNPWLRAFIDPTLSNASTKEDRYGEAGEILFGIDNIVHDAVRNVTGRTIQDWGVAAGMNIGGYKKPGDTGWTPAVDRWFTNAIGSSSWLKAIDNYAKSIQ